MVVQQLTLLVVGGSFAVCRLGGEVGVPSWATAGPFFSITRTAEELSIACHQDAVPEGIQCERGWRCVLVAGAIPFAVIGVLAALTAPLAEAGVRVFALATFDTDYLLMKEADFEAAQEALRRQGHAVHSTSGVIG
jgi:hypothetical protein